MLEIVKLLRKYENAQNSRGRYFAEREEHYQGRLFSSVEERRNR